MAVVLWRTRVMCGFQSVSIIEHPGHDELKNGTRKPHMGHVTASEYMYKQQ